MTKLRALGDCRTQKSTGALRYFSARALTQTSASERSWQRPRHRAPVLNVLFPLFPLPRPPFGEGTSGLRAPCRAPIFDGSSRYSASLAGLIGPAGSSRSSF